MKTKNMTFSLPVDLIDQLRVVNRGKGFSKFVVATLEEAVKKEIAILKIQYMAANNDSDTQETISDWSALDAEEWE